MNKAIKIVSTMLIALILIMVVTNSAVCATNTSTVLNGVANKTDLNKVQGGDDISSLAGKIISFLQYLAIIGGAVILAVLGIKYMMGSVEEKAEYKKSFMPLIVGVVVVMGAISIANILFQTFGK